MSSLDELEFMDIQSMYYCPVHEDRNISNHSYESHSLTVIIGAKCKDGIVLIADRKLTNTLGGKDDTGIKIYGDLEHILIGYTGAVKMFDIFRKHIVGDVIVTRDDVERYKYDNVIKTTSNLTYDFNESIGRRLSLFEMLIAKHRGIDSELYHIDINGKANKVNYKAIGSGKLIADLFCKKSFDDIYMKEFIKMAYTSIIYMERFAPHWEWALVITCQMLNT